MLSHAAQAASFNQAHAAKAFRPPTLSGHSVFTGRTAIDDQTGAGDIAAGLAGQQEDRTGQLLGVAPAAQGRPIGIFLARFFRENLRSARLRTVRCDAIDGNAKLAQIQRAGAGQAQ